MTAPNTSSAARTTPLATGSGTAAGADLHARRHSFRIARVRAFLPARLGNAGGSSSRSHPHLLRSLKRQTLNQVGDVCFEQDEISAFRGADHLVGLALHRPYPSSSSNLCLTIRDWHEEFRECPTSCRSTNVLRMRKEL